MELLCNSKIVTQQDGRSARNNTDGIDMNCHWWYHTKSFLNENVSHVAITGSIWREKMPRGVTTQLKIKYTGQLFNKQVGIKTERLIAANV